jgi:hypothetical protein
MNSLPVAQKIRFAFLFGQPLEGGKKLFLACVFPFIGLFYEQG